MFTVFSRCCSVVGEVHAAAPSHTVIPIMVVLLWQQVRTQAGREKTVYNSKNIPIPQNKNDQMQRRWNSLPVAVISVCVGGCGQSACVCVFFSHQKAQQWSFSSRDELCYYRSAWECISQQGLVQEFRLSARRSSRCPYGMDSETIVHTWISPSVGIWRSDVFGSDAGQR